jgi:type IV pilus assembly protein PilV
MELTNMKTRKQTGFTMLEVLVTMIIVSFGLLGIAGIILNGLKNNQSSYARSQASWLANDMVDRVRANSAVLDVNDTKLFVSTSAYDLALNAATPAAASPATIVNTDLRAWRTVLADALPSGTGSVSFNATSKKLTVVVQWDDSRAKGGSNTETFIVETRL